MTALNALTAVPAIDVTEVLNALEVWIKRRPALEFGNYVSPYDQGDRRAQGTRAYNDELRSINQDLKRARKALAEARAMTPRPEVLRDSFRAFSGRLQWVERPYDGCPCDSGCCARCQKKPSHVLAYTTGQYFPTEYRKAAAAVLELYVAGCKQAEAAEAPRTFSYTCMDDVIRANQSIGNHWFDKSTMRFFRTRICTRLIAGHRFITSELGLGDTRRRYTIREACADGTIDTVGEFRQFGTLATARKYVLTEDATVKALTK